MSNVTPKRQRAGAVQDAFARFGSDRTALRVLECGSHLPLYVDDQRKSSANLESLPRGTLTEAHRSCCFRIEMGMNTANPRKTAHGVLIAFFLVALVWPGLTDAATDQTGAQPDRKTVVVLGNSLASGYGLDPSEAFPALLQEKIDAAGLDFTVVNAGSSGDTSAGGLRRIDWLLKRRIDVLVLELGGNDGLRGIPPQATRENLQGIIDRARDKYPEIRVVIAGMQMPPNMGAEYAKAFQKIFPELAASNNAALVPFLLEGVGGKVELNQPDRIHPTAEGQRIIAQTVWVVLEEVLREV
jgi:acyl-CoA thioesterase I